MKPPEEVKRNLVRQWVAKAEADFGVAEHLLSQSAPYLDAIGFHAQQAVEKYLKAFLVHHQIELPKTHDLDKLLKLVATVDRSLADSLPEITVLTDYGVDIRYPGDFPEVTPGAAKTAVELAAKVRGAARSVLRDYLKTDGA